MKAAGFTLLEVLVASGIFSVAVLGLLFALESAVGASRSVHRQKEIRAELESRLARLSMPPIRAYSDEVTVDGVKYREQVAGESIHSRNLSEIRGFWRIRVTAEWLEAGEKKNWEVGHLDYAP